MSSGFCTLNGGVLEFDLPSAWDGRVEVEFHGVKVKHVAIKCAVQPDKQFFCTDPPPLEHTIPENQGDGDLRYRIIPRFLDEPCVVQKVGTQGMNGELQPGGTNNPDFRKEQWLFTTPADPAEKVSIVVSIDDEAGGGPILLRAVDFLTKRYRDWLRRRFRRPTT